MTEQFAIAVTTLAGVVATGITTAVAAYLASKNSKEVSQINDAVNHRHERGPNAMKLYDLIWESHKDGKELIEWKRGYDNGPLDNGSKTSRFVSDVNQRLEALESERKDRDPTKGQS